MRSNGPSEETSSANSYPSSSSGLDEFQAESFGGADEHIRKVLTRLLTESLRSSGANLDDARVSKMLFDESPSVDCERTIMSAIASLEPDLARIFKNALLRSGGSAAVEAVLEMKPVDLAPADVWVSFGRFPGRELRLLCCEVLASLAGTNGYQKSQAIRQLSKAAIIDAGLIPDILELPYFTDCFSGSDANRSNWILGVEAADIVKAGLNADPIEYPGVSAKVLNKLASAPSSFSRNAFLLLSVFDEIPQLAKPKIWSWSGLPPLRIEDPKRLSAICNSVEPDPVFGIELCRALSRIPPEEFGALKPSYVPSFIQKLIYLEDRKGDIFRERRYLRDMANRTVPMYLKTFLAKCSWAGRA